jgi:hypothetical protein
MGIPARKKPRREDHLPKATDEAAIKTASPESSVGLLPPPTIDTVDANVDHVQDTILTNAGASGATGRWTTEEDAELTSAIAKTNTKWWGKEYKLDWVAIASLIPGRTNTQCRGRWHNFLNPSITLSARRTGKWTEDEDIKLKAAVQMHGGKDWLRIATLVSGRTRIQCRSRWYNFLNPSITLSAGRAGKWTEDEDIELKAAVQMHGGKDWLRIATLVSGRTKIQCRSRWRNALDPSIVRTAGSTGKWTAVEDIKLKAAVQMHGGKNWEGIAALVPSRTKLQCANRWQTNKG